MWSGEMAIFDSKPVVSDAIFKRLHNRSIHLSTAMQDSQQSPNSMDWILAIGIRKSLLLRISTLSRSMRMCCPCSKGTNVDGFYAGKDGMIDIVHLKLCLVIKAGYIIDPIFVLYSFHFFHLAIDITLSLLECHGEEPRCCEEI